VLWGHDAAVTALVADTVLGVCVSGCRAGCVVVHALRSGEHVRAFPLLDCASSRSGGPRSSPCEVSALALDGASGDVAAHSWGLNLPLSVFSINGLCKASVTVPRRINALAFSRTGAFLIAACDGGRVTFRNSATLEVPFAPLSYVARLARWGVSVSPNH
jgi:hypothetical protein